MSRLETNSERFRNDIETRNLYTPENPYRLEEGKLVKAINSIASIISPFSSYDVGNTLISRLVTPNTPIQQIGLEMLGKQFGHTVRSLGSAEYLPSVKFSNLFDGNPNTKLFTSKIDFQITRRESQTSVGKIIEELTGNYRPINPFKNNPTNLDYFRQTGKGQQINLVDSLNKSLYKPSSQEWKGAINNVELQYPSPLNKNSRIHFAGLDQNFYPYTRFYDFGNNVSASEILNARLNSQQLELYSYLENSGKEFEYGSTQKYLDALGKIDTGFNSVDGNRVINDDNNGLDDTTNNKIIWGRDGIDSNYDGITKGFDKNINESPFGDLTSKNYNDGINRFNQSGNNTPRTGLLNYTKELLNSRGRYGNFDLTKKKFQEKDGEVFYNGLPFEKNTTDSVDRRRQHSIVDPYNRFVKAIRFEGNEKYGGKPTSVIHKTILPKITPSRDEYQDQVSIKKFMFSIENLATSTKPIVDENSSVVGAVLDDEFGTEVPICELGNDGGRLMWFAPYDIKLNEQSIAKHESTSFIGRSEPIYTYNNSERIASLSFKLLIDYPPQIKGDPNLGTHSQTAKFFAFGSEGRLPREQDIAQKQKRLDDLIKQRAELQTEKEINPTPNLPIIKNIDFFFPNDVPEVGNESTAIDNSISNGYEDGIKTGNEIDGRDFGLNSNFTTQLNDAIRTAFSEDNRGRYGIKIYGYATQLFNSAASGVNPTTYNLSLSQRRIDAMKAQIDKAYQAIYGRTLEQDAGDIIISEIPRGLSQSPDSTNSALSIPTKESKTYRRVTIEFEPLPAKLERKEIPFASENIKRQQDINGLNEEIDRLRSDINNKKRSLQRGFECFFNQYTIEDGIAKGWDNAKRNVNKFVPVFHSQTPEDFHRRLTFLQQCVRQGNAVRRKVEQRDGTNDFSAKNSVFGRQPIQILRLGDFFHTKIVIDQISIDYGDYPWDMNPEGMGMQFMVADVDIQFRIIGGMSLRGPIDALQNAVSFNYYANSTYYDNGVYKTATRAETTQYSNESDINNEPTNNPLTNRKFTE